MDELKEIIRNKSKTKSKQILPKSPLSVETNHQGVAGDLCVMNKELSGSIEHGTKRSRLSQTDGICSTFQVEDFLLGKSDNIPDGYALNRKDRRILDSYMDGMNLPHNIPGEDDISCILRCKEAIVTKFSGDVMSDTTKIVMFHGDVHLTNAGGLNDVWFSLQKKLVHAQGARTMYDWFLHILGTWKTEIGEDEASNAHQMRESRCHFSEACLSIDLLLDDIESGRLEASVKEHLIAIAEYSSKGLFQEAETEYMRITLGKQTWIIGVGNCFIQERSSLDRIREVKHIMNDDRVRNYIQCVKRLISRSKQYSSN